MNRQGQFKLCIPFEDLPQGGMYSFLANLRSYLERHGIPFTRDVFDDYDLLLVNSFMVPYRVVRRAKRRRPQLRVIQRVDGAAQDYGRRDDADARQASVNTLADLTVFQSRYGKYATTQKFKIIAQDGPIIYNPVDIESFRPDGEKLKLSGQVRVCHVTFSTNARKGVRALYAVAKANPDIDFILIGRYLAPPEIANVHLLGLLDRKTLPKALRACDLYLTFSENEACPNTVLEALGSGLPVLYLDSGGTGELVGECGVPVRVDNFRQQLETILKRRDELSRAARERAVRHFSPDQIFDQYMDAIERAQRRPLPTMWDLLRMRMQGYPVIENPIPQIFSRLRAKGRTLIGDFV